MPNYHFIDLQAAVYRIEDMMMADDGQAWKEAEKFLQHLSRRYKNRLQFNSRVPKENPYVKS